MEDCNETLRGLKYKFSKLSKYYIFQFQKITRIKNE